MNCIKEYQITLKGSSNGLEIPENHRVCVVSKHEYFEGGEWFLRMIVLTYIDQMYKSTVLNDNFPNNEIVVALGINFPTAGGVTLVKNEMSKMLESFDNVGVGNYTEI